MKAASNPALAWLLAAAWTALMFYFMLAPGEGTFAHDVSAAAGGSDLTDAIGHIFLTFVETGLLTSALRASGIPQRRALMYAAAFTTVVSIVLEVAQLWVPYRGAAVLDAAANALGVALFAYALLRRGTMPTERA